MGFPTPMKQWLAAELYAPVRDLLAGRDVRERGIYNPQAILRDLEAHRRGENDVSERVFRVVQFELWVRMLNEHGSGNDTAPAPFRPVCAARACRAGTGMRSRRESGWPAQGAVPPGIPEG